MTIKQLAKELCKIEGLKKEVNIAQMSEILGVISDLLYAEFKKDPIPLVREKYLALLASGLKRSKKKGNQK